MRKLLKLKILFYSKYKKYFLQNNKISQNIIKFRVQSLGFNILCTTKLNAFTFLLCLFTLPTPFSITNSI